MKASRTKDSSIIIAAPVGVALAHGTRPTPAQPPPAAVHPIPAHGGLATD